MQVARRRRNHDPDSVIHHFTKELLLDNESINPVKRLTLTL